MTELVEMTQIVLERPGGPEALISRTAPIPSPGKGQLLIETEAAGVAFNDVTTRQGRNPGPLPQVIGFDVVGRVVAVGPGTSGYRVGQRVAALIGVGGYSTHVVIEADRAVPVPDGLDAPQVDALVLNYLTAWQMLYRVARIAAGQSTLVLGAAGGVGSALCELALLTGATVFGTSSSGRRAAVEKSGAQWISTLRDLPAPVDASFDPVGGPGLADTRQATARTGIVVSYGFSFTVDAGHSKLRGLAGAVTAIIRAKLTPGADVRIYQVERSVNDDNAAYRDDLSTLIGLLAEHAVEPTVTTIPLQRAAEAHARLEGRQIIGKLVLTV